jgi:hypothetical protein
VDRVAQQRHAGVRPGLDRGRGGEVELLDCVGVGLGDEPAQHRVPAGHPLLDDLAQGLAAQAVGAAGIAAAVRDKGPHDVVVVGRVAQQLVCVQARRGEPVPQPGGHVRRLPPAAEHRGEQEVPRRHHHVLGGHDPVRQPLRGLAGQRELAADADGRGVDPARIRQQLAADPGPGAVGADQQVTGGRAAVGEVGRDRAVAGLHVVGELLAEVDRVLEPGQQNLAERDAADRVRAAGRSSRSGLASSSMSWRSCSSNTPIRSPWSPEVATRICHSSGGRQSCSAALPGGSMLSR